MNSKSATIWSWLKQSLLFLVTVAFATSVAIFLLHKYPSRAPDGENAEGRKTRESRTSKEEKKRVEYHAMVAEKIYADNIREYLK